MRPAAHVLKCAIGLEPAELTTHLAREFPTAALGATLDEGTDADQVGLAEESSAIALHEVLSGVLKRVGGRAVRKVRKRFGDSCQGKKLDKSCGAHPPLSTHACRYSVSQRRELICQHCTNIMNRVNRFAVSSETLSVRYSAPYQPELHPTKSGLHS